MTIKECLNKLDETTDCREKEFLLEVLIEDAKTKYIENLLRDINFHVKIYKDERENKGTEYNNGYEDALDLVECVITG